MEKILSSQNNSTVHRYYQSNPPRDKLSFQKTKDEKYSSKTHSFCDKSFRVTRYITNKAKVKIVKLLNHNVNLVNKFYALNEIKYDKIIKRPDEILINIE